MFDLGALALSDLVRLSSALRVPPAMGTMEQAASYVVRYLYDNLLDKASGGRSCALVRCYKTHPYAALEPDVRASVGEVADSDTLRCLTLLATAGDEPEWNDRSQAGDDRVIPLRGDDVSRRAPVLATLVARLGVDVESAPTATRPAPYRPVFEVVHVPEAVGSPLLPDQEGLVLPYGVRSVVGFGGLLPDGELFTVLLFSRTPVSRETAEQFRTVTGSVALALLPHAHRVFDGSPPADMAPDVLARARADALDHLLQVREVAILEQSLRIEQALAEVEDRAAELTRSRAVLAESEARKAAILSASLDAIVTVAADGRIVEFNATAERMFGYPAADAVGAPMSELIVPPALRAAHHEGMRRHLETGESRILGRRVEIDALRADGTEFPVELAVTRIDVEGPPMFTAHVRDLTDVRRVEAELRELADTLQAGLLPPREPAVPGVDVATYYRAGGAGMRVGGDFYDVFKLGEDEWGVIIGDVCGKGARAASVTALVRYTARAAAAHSGLPADVMNEINAALADGPDADDRYCSAVYARLRVAPGRVDVQSCCGGHPSPIVVRADGGIDLVAPAGGQLVGLFPDYEAACGEFVLDAGDVVVLYTDGVTEARAATGELFGQDRLAELLRQSAGASARELVASVTTALREWTDTPDDDIAIIAFGPVA